MYSMQTDNSAVYNGNFLLSLPYFGKLTKKQGMQFSHHLSLGNCQLQFL